MFGISKTNPWDEKLNVLVHVSLSDETFAMAHKLWSENVRMLHHDPASGKEYLRFTYAQPACNAWLQRERGSEGIIELVVQWKDSKSPTEVYVLMPQAGAAKGGATDRAKAVLHAMLTTPSVVPSGSA